MHKMGTKIFGGALVVVGLVLVVYGGKKVLE
jgi:hypothetical protein